MGTIGTAVGTKVGSTIKIREGNYTSTVEVCRGVTIGDGDLALMESVNGKRYVIGVALTGAPPPRKKYSDDDDPDPKPKVVTGDSTFTPIETRTYRAGKWLRDTSDLFQGDFGGLNTGVAFFGDQIKTLKGSTIQRITVNLTRIPGGNPFAQTPTLWLVAQKKRPSGAVTRTDDFGGPSLSVGDSFPNFVLPDSWGTALANGTAGGIAVYDGDGAPVMRFAGMGTSSAAFTLRIDWKRLES